MFESPVADFAVVNAFRTWFDANVGTEIELDEADAGLYYVVCCEMTRRETAACVAWWNERGHTC